MRLESRFTCATSLGLLLGAALFLTACGGGGGGVLPPGQLPPTNITPFLGMEEVVYDYEDDVKRFNLGIGASQLPAFVDWSSTMPPIGDQGQQGSCVGWALGYYLKSSWEVREENWAPTSTSRQFSPAWIYNQINGGLDGGSNPFLALDLMTSQGTSTLATMPYDDTDFLTQPTTTARNEAANYKNLGRRVFGEYNVEALKDYLVETGPFVFGIKVYDSFYNPGTVYQGATGTYLGGHAIVCAGYDDGVGGGSWRLRNSWGTNWGDNGSVWVPYAVMEDLFLEALGMVDGPNGTGGGGGGLLPAPTGFNASVEEADYYVWTAWNFVSGAWGYVLQRQEPNGSWRTIAQPPADTWYHYDFNVEADTTYNYRVAAAMDQSGAVGEWATTSGKTAVSATVQQIFLTASNPAAGGTAYPDKIALSWSQLTGDHWYMVVRADSSEGLRNGQYFVLDVLYNVGTYDDLTEPSSTFVYKIYSVNASTDALSGESDEAWGSTSGSAAGQDIGITDASGPTTVTRGVVEQGDITLFNYSLSQSPNQQVAAGIEYYFDDGSYGILWYWNNAWDEFIMNEYTNSAIASYAEAYWWLYARVPEYLFPSDPQGNDTASHWWIYWTAPLDSADQQVDDLYEYDNWFYTYDTLFIQ